MKVTAICQSRNEADILEAFVRHHAKFCDNIVIVLHRCEDDSAKILEELAQEGLPVVVRIDNRFAHDQKSIMNALLREEMIARDADWVLPLDSDEFVTGDVVRILHESTEPMLVGWQSYIPMSSDDPKEPNVLKRIVHRRIAERQPWRKTFVPRVFWQEHRGATLTFGNHELVNPDGTGVPSAVSPLHIAHFPVRSAKQIQRKTMLGWEAYQESSGRVPGGSFHWKVIAKELSQNGNITSKRLTNLALFYATQKQWDGMPEVFKKNEKGPNPDDDVTDEITHDPVPCSFELRYTA